MQKLRGLDFTVPKNRKPKFDLSLTIHDLTNIPLVCGACSVKWDLPHSTSAEHRGRTYEALISHDHKAVWNYRRQLTVRLTIDRNTVLQECEIHFEIVQRYHESGKGGRVVLGNVRLNLAEYIDRPKAGERGDGDGGDGEEPGVTRRYLMQNSKINSTLKVGIHMKQIEGDTNFIAPPLKTAMVFGGIAGVIGTEPGDEENAGGNIPSISSKTRELSELQDVYRRNLAATWACQTGELPPDKLVEDLFSGGDGGAMNPPEPKRRFGHSSRNGYGRDESVGSTNTSDAESKHTIKPNHLSPDISRGGNDHQSPGHYRFGSRAGDGHGSSIDVPAGASTMDMSSLIGRESIEQQMQHSHGHRSHRNNDQKPYKEITEFDVRDDLRSWRITAH